MRTIFAQCEKVSHNYKISLVNAEQVKVTSGADGSSGHTTEAVVHSLFPTRFTPPPPRFMIG